MWNEIWSCWKPTVKVGPEVVQALQNCGSRWCCRPANPNQALRLQRCQQPWDRRTGSQSAVGCTQGFNIVSYTRRVNSLFLLSELVALLSVRRGFVSLPAGSWSPGCWSAGLCNIGYRDPCLWPVSMDRTWQDIDTAIGRAIHPLI